MAENGPSRGRGTRREADGLLKNIQTLLVKGRDEAKHRGELTRGRRVTFERRKGWKERK